MTIHATTRTIFAKRFAWVFCVVAVLATLWTVANETLALMPQNGLLAILANVSYSLLPPAFSVLGALVITRQPRHIIGWLMLVPALTSILDMLSAAFVNKLTVPPADPSFLFLVAVWASRSSWVLAVFPLLLILLLFPTGRPPSQRWNWLVIALVGLQALFVLVIGFGQHLLPFSEAWSVANPIGVIPDAWVSTLYSMLLQIILGVLAVLCTASLFVRYRRSSLVEQTQIKWIAFASSIFGLMFLVTILTLITTGKRWGDNDPMAVAVQLPTGLLLLTIPIAIAIGILRHRLFDIDIIIRRTLVYSALTITLGLIYVGCILVSQALATRLTGSSKFATVVSTLVIVALFFPLRRRIQNIIDRRFYRRKYNAQRVLAAFAVTARDETNLAALTDELGRVVNETMQPEFVGVWLVAQKEHRT